MFRWMLTISCKVAQNGLECHLRWTKIQSLPGGMPPDPLAWAAFSTKLLSETVEICNSFHKTCQELVIKFCRTTFNFAPTPLFLRFVNIHEILSFYPLEYMSHPTVMYIENVKFSACKITSSWHCVKLYVLNIHTAMYS